jgi:hypothetical protein
MMSREGGRSGRQVVEGKDGNQEVPCLRLLRFHIGHGCHLSRCQGKESKIETIWESK